ncbi:MAG: tetratricopeptide repeat-containing sensor histidine kinase [Bacteroidales bacterium]|nr:tetratricopeptide repeat-containing sensor histidine kinase [Bacteroidales bacterium]
MKLFSVFKYFTIQAFLFLFFLPLFSHAALSKIDSLQNIIQSSKNQQEVVAAQIELARKLIPAKLDTAFFLLKKSEPFLGVGENLTKANLFNTYGLYYWFRNNQDSAIYYLKKTIALPEMDELVYYKAEAVNNTGTLYSKLGESDSSLHYLNKALEIDQRRNNQTGLAKTYYDLAVIYKRRDQLELSVQYLLKSIAIHEKQKATDRLIASLNVLAGRYFDIKDTANCIQTYKRAEKLAVETLDTNNMILTYSNMSHYYLMTDNLAFAIVYSKKGIDLALKTNALDKLSSLYGNAAIAFSKINDHKKSVELIRKSKNFIPYVSAINKAGVYLATSDIYLKAGLVDSSKYFNDMGMAEARRIGSVEWESWGYKSLASIDSAKNDFKSALKHFQKSVILRDSILNNQHKSRIEELFILHDLENKEKENVVLRTQNALNEKIIRNQWYVIFLSVIILALVALFGLLQSKARKKIMLQKQEIEQKNMALNALNKTKDKFITIIAHDLRSPFNSLLGLLDVLVSDYDSISDNQKLQLLKSLHESSTNTYNLLVNLLEWSLTQRNGLTYKPEKVNVRNTIATVFSFLASRADQKSHQLINNVSEETEIITDPNIVSNILINLINNSIKFTPANGIISVEALELEDKIRIYVKDNGVGIPAERIGSIFDIDSDFQRRGTENEVGTGLGLILVKEFVELCKGKISVESEPDKGSSFCVELPQA